MDLVYMNSTCTIAACESLSSVERIYTARDPQSAAHISFSETYSDRTVNFKLVADWVTPIKKRATLFQRGWILQERLLSPRIIYMCRFPFLDCNVGTRTESNPSVYINKPTGYVSRNYTPGYMTRDFSYSFEGWKAIVSDYTKAKLSFPGDKLIALAGVARQFHARLKVDYFAGLWGGKYLIESLMWRVILKGKRPPEYRGKAGANPLKCSKVKAHLHGSTVVVMGIPGRLDIIRYAR
jgi:hypothetical protein